MQLSNYYPNFSNKFSLESIISERLGVWTNSLVRNVAEVKPYYPNESKRLLCLTVPTLKPGNQIFFNISTLNSYRIYSSKLRLDDLHKMPTMPTNLERFTHPKVDITKPKQPTKEVKKGLWTEKFLINLYESLKVIMVLLMHRQLNEIY